jgi:hypothetical protein
MRVKPKPVSSVRRAPTCSRKESHLTPRRSGRAEYNRLDDRNGIRPPSSGPGPREQASAIGRTAGSLSLGRRVPSILRIVVSTVLVDLQVSRERDPQLGG